MSPIISIRNVSKVYASGHKALDDVNLDIEKGEILALLGPNGAGKTTLISVICGIVSPTNGSITVDGYDIQTHYRETRSRIGLVPQELSLEMFETVWDTINFSRGLFGKPRDHACVEKILRMLSLWDKKDSQVMALSGGMKRRVLIAKALAHEPQVLFLDEPTAGVDVELRKDMWKAIRELSANGVTIILTTHYIEEAEEMAHRIGIINKGKMRLVQDKHTLMQQLGKKQMQIDLTEPLMVIPASLEGYDLKLANEGMALVYEYDTQKERTGIVRLLNDLQHAGVQLHDVQTRQSSLEDIFVTLVEENA
jgi:ABC-2 type transport system ATP-binding protein